MPSENWKNNLGGALLNYAQGTGTWIVYRQHSLMDGLKNTQQQTNKKDFSQDRQIKRL